jgi:LPS O-antigen subunit length determinant protein (WzzB/FepE family)
MSNPEEEIENKEQVTQWEARQIIGDYKKFLNYVLVPNHKTGKDKIFIGTLGFRPNNNEDAQELLSTYISQAQAKFSQKDYVIGTHIPYPKRFFGDGARSR